MISIYKNKYSYLLTQSCYVKSFFLIKVRSIQFYNVFFVGFTDEFIKGLFSVNTSIDSKYISRNPEHVPLESSILYTVIYTIQIIFIQS